MSFCWLPPEKLDDFRLGFAGRTSKADIKDSQFFLTNAFLSNNP